MRYFRKPLRIPGWDYQGYGWYHVTICIHEKECLLGDVINGSMHLNTTGLLIHYRWQWLQWSYPFVRLDEWQVMPNHLHGIVVLGHEGNMGRNGAWPRATPRSPLPNWNAPFAISNKRKSLGDLIGAFKTVSTRLINTAMEFEAGTKVWQRNFYDQMIRSDDELHAIRFYITQNPNNWENDSENEHVILMPPHNPSDIIEA